MFPNGNLNGISGPIHATLPHVSIGRSTGITIVCICTCGDNFNTCIFNRRDTISGFVGPGPSNVSSVGATGLGVSMARGKMAIDRTTRIAICSFANRRVTTRSGTARMALLPNGCVIGTISMSNGSISASGILVG